MPQPTGGMGFIVVLDIIDTGIIKQLHTLVQLRHDFLQHGDQVLHVGAHMAVRFPSAAKGNTALEIGQIQDHVPADTLIQNHFQQAGLSGPGNAGNQHMTMLVSHVQQYRAHGAFSDRDCVGFQGEQTVIPGNLPGQIGHQGAQLSI